MTSVMPKHATVVDMAAMNFEPWEHGPNGWKPPSNSEWAKDGAYLLPFVRMAWFAMYKTKAELQTIAETLEDGPFDHMMDGIAHSREFFEKFLTVLNGAEARILCAACASASSEEAALIDEEEART
jgi:hypothetical protein